jgi:hypothetical protein
MGRPRKVKVNCTYTKFIPKHMWSCNLEQMKALYPDNYMELYLKKKEYHRQYYQKNKSMYNIKRRFNYVLKELMSKF